MATYAQVITYEQDISVAVNTNILGITFDNAITGGRFTAWDNDSHNTIAKEILAGTEEMGAHSCLRAQVTALNVAEDAGAGSLDAAWKTQTKITTTYQLKGDTYYQDFGGAIGAGNQVRFVITSYVPNDFGAGTTGHDPVLTAKYTYTGTAPTPAWKWNTGTEAVPVWTVQGASFATYPTGPDTTVSVLDPVTAPASGTKFPEEWWIQTA